jgi:hypothetical protein
MKKLFTFLVVGILTISGAVAQKGDWALSGNLALNYLSPETIDGNKNGESRLDFQFGPSLLYGFSKHFYLGGELSANMHYYKDYQADKMTKERYKNMFGIAPIARCYAYHGRRIGIFNDTKAGFYFGADKAKTKYTDITLSLTPGIEIFLGSRFSLSTSLNEMLSCGYEHSNPKGDHNSTNRFYLGFVFNRMELNYAPLTFSFTYHFPKQKRDIEIVEIEEYKIIK